MNRECILPKVDAALRRWFTEVNASDFRGIADQDLQRKANEQEIIESLAEGDRVVSSDSGNQVLDIAQGELRISYLEGFKVLHKLRRFCIQEDFDFTPVTEWICSLEKFTNSKLYSKQLKISDLFN